MEPTDDELVKMAKARIGFKMHAAAYVVVNLLFVAIWWVTSGGQTPTFNDRDSSYYWPIWPMLGWGVGLAMHGFATYGAGKDWEAREVEKLRERYGRR